MATTNPWKAFQGLLPQASRIVGIVVSKHGNGTSTVRLRDDTTMTAKGNEVEVGKKVLIENANIVREVPNLPVYDGQV